MTEIQFYHLTATPFERAFPKLVEKAVQGGFRVVIRAGTEAQAESISELLWTYDPASFLPHGTRKDGNGAVQPVYLTAEDDVPNAANLLILTDGAPWPERHASFDRALDFFDGNDAEAVAAARARWKRYQAEGHAVSYIKQSESGAWTKA